VKFQPLRGELNHRHETPVVLYTLRTPIISLKVLADPADISQNEWEERSPSFRQSLRNAFACIESLQFDFFNAKELFTWRQQKSVIR
jgi:hypothetical protein